MRRRERENHPVILQGASRRQIARTLNAAYAAGLLSEKTFAGRVEQLLGTQLIDPKGLIGDLSFRDANRWRARRARAVAALTRLAPLRWAGHGRSHQLLLALDWTGTQEELLLGRHYECDVVLSHPTVSRKHARLVFRDGNWVLQELQSMNGTVVNGVRVGRCELRPGDLLQLGDERLHID
jgi:hypothetical protein